MTDFKKKGKPDSIILALKTDQEHHNSQFMKEKNSSLIVDPNQKKIIMRNAAVLIRDYIVERNRNRNSLVTTPNRLSQTVCEGPSKKRILEPRFQQKSTTPGPSMISSRKYHIRRSLPATKQETEKIVDPLKITSKPTALPGPGSIAILTRPLPDNLDNTFEQEEYLKKEKRRSLQKQMKIQYGMHQLDQIIPKSDVRFDRNLAHTFEQIERKSKGES